MEKREKRFQQYMSLHVQTLGEGQPARRVDREVAHKCSPTPVGVSVFTPESGDVRGVYLHMHGGSWFLGGSAWQNDVRLLGLADRLRIAIVSVDYRLAPEHPWPACAQDCTAAAAWLVENAQSEFGTNRLIIGGESAGGHLCASTMLRLRGALGLADDAPYPYCGANLVYGCYDLAGTPSMRHYTKPLVFNWDDLQQALDVLLPPGTDRRAPDVSPLHAPPEAFGGMPPALFSVGTDDALLDDTLFMAARWAQHANADVALWPGGAHGVGHFGPHAKTALGARAHARIEEWMESFLA